MNDNEQKVFTMNPKANLIFKERTEDGAWEYRVYGADGVLISCIRFAGRNEENRLTNSDLLEIVRDRLSALISHSRGKNRNAANCQQHVSEAIFWSDAHGTYHIKPDSEAETEENTSEEA